MAKLIISLLLILFMQISGCTQVPPAESVPTVSPGTAGTVEEQPAPEHTELPGEEPQPEETGETLDDHEEESAMTKINVSFGDHTYLATLEENSSAQAFLELLQENGGALTVDMSDYGSFEKVGPLGTTLPRNDEQITTSAGDIILYQGNSITVYYAQNSWNFTRLGRIDDPSGLKEALGAGDIAITFSLASAEE